MNIDTVSNMTEEVLLGLQTPILNVLQPMEEQEGFYWFRTGRGIITNNCKDSYFNRYYIVVMVGERHDQHMTGQLDRFRW